MIWLFLHWGLIALLLVIAAWLLARLHFLPAALVALAAIVKAWP